MNRSAFRYSFVCAGLLVGACSPSSTEPAATGTGGQGTGGSGVPPISSGGPSPGTGGAGTGGSASGGSLASTGGSASGGSLASTGGSSTGGSAPGTGGGIASTGGQGKAGGTSGTLGSTGGASAGGAPVVVDPGTEGDGNITVGPNYTASPDLAVKNVPHSAKFQFTMTAAMSKIFLGTDAVLNSPTSWSRQITVFIPSQYVDGTEAPFMVMQDGNVSGNGTPRMVTVAENLANDPLPTRRIPPLVIIFVPNGGGDGPGSERGLEYDTVSDRYGRFINTEVLPAILADSGIKAKFPNFKLTSNPEGRGAYGCSSGSPAAFGMGWFADYHRIITYSGTFVDLQKADAATEAATPNGAWDYAAMITAAPVKPLRVFLEAADKDNGNTETAASHHNWLIANQNMAMALKAKGYHYRFVYATGAGHCDDKVQQQTLPDTVSWMWNSYKAN